MTSQSLLDPMMMLTFILELTKVQIYNKPKLLARKFIDNLLKFFVDNFQVCICGRQPHVFFLYLFPV